MIETFTQNNLVRHLYTEESKQEAEHMNSILASDDELTENFNDYQSIMNSMNYSLLEPHPDSVNFIIEYSRITA